MTCRNLLDDIKSGSVTLARDEPGGCLFIGQVVSGMYAARAWVRLLHGTWEPVVLRDDQLVASGLRLAVSGRGLERQKPRGANSCCRAQGRTGS